MFRASLKNYATIIVACFHTNKQKKRAKDFSSIMSLSAAVGSAFGKRSTAAVSGQEQHKTEEKNITTEQHSYWSDREQMIGRGEEQKGWGYLVGHSGRTFLSQA